MTLCVHITTAIPSFILAPKAVWLVDYACKSRKEKGRNKDTKLTFELKTQMFSGRLSNELIQWWMKSRIRGMKYNSFIFY